MTVKELKEILDACNETAIVAITDYSGTSSFDNDEVFATRDGLMVVIDLRADADKSGY